MKFQKIQNSFFLFYLLLSLLYSISSFSCPTAFSDTNSPTLFGKIYRTLFYRSTPSDIKHPTPDDTKDFTLIESQKIVRDENIRSLRELIKERKTNDLLKRIPLNLDVIYRDQGWISYPDFFGTVREWYLYRKLKAYFEELDLDTAFNNPLPGEFSGISYWVTIDHAFQYLIHNKSVTWQHFMYEDSQAVVQNLNIKTQDELRKRRLEIRIKLRDKQPVSRDELSLLSYVPADPRKFYRDQGWSREDFFAKEWLPVSEAQALVQELGITSVFELWNRRKTDTRLQRIPSHPRQVYGVDYPAFFGLTKVSPSPEQIKKTAEENKPFLDLVYSLVGLYPGFLSTPHEVRQKIVNLHLQKLAIENTFDNPS